MDMYAYTNDPREKTHVEYTSEGNLGSTIYDIHQIYTWIGTPIIHVKNTRGKQVKQNPHERVHH